MALATYADLQASVLEWTGRDDLSTKSADFIRLAEAAFNRVIYTEDSVSAETAATAATTGIIALPANFRRMRIVRDTQTYPTTLESVPDSAGILFSGTLPVGYSIVGTNLQLWPKAAHDVVYKYYATIPALSTGVNWLYAAHPDIYLLGALVAAEAYVRDDPRIMVWKSQLAESIAALTDSNEKRRWSENRLTIKGKGGY